MVKWYFRLETISYVERLDRNICLDLGGIFVLFGVPVVVSFPLLFFFLTFSRTRHDTLKRRG